MLDFGNRGSPSWVEGVKTAYAIFEDGVFRPLSDVDLPDRAEVEFEPRLKAATQNGDEHLDRVYAILSKSYDTDDPELAARHAAGVRECVIDERNAWIGSVVRSD